MNFEKFSTRFRLIRVIFDEKRLNFEKFSTRLAKKCNKKVQHHSSALSGKNVSNNNKTQSTVHHTLNFD